MANWISTREARDLVAAGYRASDEAWDIEASLRKAETAILRRLEQGALASKARTMTFLQPDGKCSVERKNEVDWTLDPSFWQALMVCSSSEQTLDWIAGDFAFIIDPTDPARKWQSCFAAEMAFGVRFERDDLPLEHSSAPGAAKGGRKALWNWPAAVSAVWSQIHVGDLKPSTQAEVEQAVRLFLTEGDHEPSESGVRAHAKLIWKDLNSEDASG